MTATRFEGRVADYSSIPVVTERNRGMLMHQQPPVIVFLKTIGLTYQHRFGDAILKGYDGLLDIEPQCIVRPIFGAL